MRTASAVFCLIMLAVSARLESQDLSDLYPFAHYTLNNTPDDALGMQNPMALFNTVYEGSAGIYINGVHPLLPGGSYARTYYMEAMTDAKFAVQLEFKIEDLDGQYRCIVVCGLSAMYLGLFILPSNEFSILLDGNTSIEVPQVVPEEETWYEFTMIYDTVTTQARFYLDGLNIASATMAVDHVQGDAFVTNYNQLGGQPLNGNWRNLRIFGTDGASALEAEFRSSAGLIVYPNPVSELLHFTASKPGAVQWQVSALSGEVALSGAVSGLSGEVNIRALPDGMYVLNLLDKNGSHLCGHQFIHRRG